MPFVENMKKKMKTRMVSEMVETFEANPEYEGLNHHGDLPYKVMDNIYKDARKEREYNMNHPKDGSKVPLSRRKDWELIESDTVDDGGDLLIVEALYEDKSSRNTFYGLTFYFDLTNHTSPYKINPNDENSYRWDFYNNFNFDPVNPRGYASLIISGGKDEGRIISSHSFKEMNAETFEATTGYGYDDPPERMTDEEGWLEMYDAYLEYEDEPQGMTLEEYKKWIIEAREEDYQMQVKYEQRLKDEGRDMDGNPIKGAETFGAESLSKDERVKMGRRIVDDFNRTFHTDYKYGLYPSEGYSKIRMYGNWNNDEGFGIYTELDGMPLKKWKWMSQKRDSDGDILKGRYERNERYDQWKQRIQKEYPMFDFMKISRYYHRSDEPTSLELELYFTYHPSKNAETDLGFKEWADQEMKTHGKKESFDDWLDDELDSHGDDITLEDWGHHELDSHYERYGAESFEDFKRKMVGDNFIAGDVGYMEALEDFYAEYLEEFEEITDEFCPKPETFEEFQERVLKNDYEMSLEAENWGGDPKGQLATALRNARIKAKQPKKPLKIEKLDAETSGQWEIGEQLEEAQMNAEGGGRIDHEGGRMVAIDEVITVDYTWRTDPDDAEVDDYTVNQEVEGKIEREMHEGDSGYGYAYAYDDEMNTVDVSYNWDKTIEEGGEEIIKFWADEEKKRKKVSGIMSDTFDELSLDSGGIKKGIVALAALGLTIFGISKLRK